MRTSRPACALLLPLQICLEPQSKPTSALGVAAAIATANFIPSTFQTLESDHYICIREKKNEAASPEVVIVDLKNGNNVTRRPIKADSAIMHWHLNIIALKAQSRTVQIFDLDNKKKLKSATMNEDVVFWKWITDSSLGLVTDSAIYHWDVFDENQHMPEKITDRHANLTVSNSLSMAIPGLR